ncbi:IS1380 family transposase [Lederbergia sp. NSJ-179]|uniref:IS1380 family transposase n=1 Tax=Lederbergia sp. NSJ-179 TaxID=2931402 RepID=UPI001FD370EE|nr:IS1380 family transposase [Lederbergia sp. NSJ-179]MCJ7843666.1 IS1380 family transposase [Lederbergia sp. NSJ-179]
MKKFIIESTSERITAHTGLAVIGNLLYHTSLPERLNQAQPSKTQRNSNISNRDVALSYIGLLCQGKNDFDHIEAFREDEFFRYALNVDNVPSSPTLRQRLNQASLTDDWKTILLEESANLIYRMDAAITPVYVGNKPYLPLDMDVSPFDNSKTMKEGVSRTYKGSDGYAPMFAYLGQEGYGVNVELREGSVHSQKGTPEFLQKTIELARRMTNQPILLRMDSACDSADNLKICMMNKVDFIIKRNPRKETAEDWLSIAKDNGICLEERPGKKVYMGFCLSTIKGTGVPIHIAFKVIERTIDKDGQILLVPEIEFDTYFTSLFVPTAKIVELYEDHGTSEQFHSELKTDLDLERLPSGKFATNDLILHFGLFAYNLLRMVGQESLKDNDVPLRKNVKRRRIRTVIQNIITLASKLVNSGRQWKLKFNKDNLWYTVFKKLYCAFY